MDKIEMKNLGFYGYHGALPEENVLGQQFFVDVILGLDLKKAGKSDQLEDTVNYAAAYELVKFSMEGKRFKLIEALSEDIAQSLLREFPSVEEITVTIRKPQAPVRGLFDHFAVEIHRSRHE